MLHTFIRPVFFAIALAFSFTTVYSQSARIEKLQKEIQLSKSPEENVNLSLQLAEILYGYSFEQGFQHAKSALLISEEENYKAGKTRALNSLGNYYYFKGDNSTALQYYRRALIEATGSNIPEFPARTFLRLSILYRQQAYFDSSKFYLAKAIKFINLKENTSLSGAYYASVGILANDMSQNVTAIYLLKKSVSIRSKLTDITRLADTWRSLGATYSDLSQYDSAEYCFSKAWTLLKLEDSPEVRILLHISQGETDFSRGNFKAAISHYDEALEKLAKNNYKRHYAFLLYKIGELYENEGAYHTAYEYLFSALKEFEALNSRQDMAKAYSQIGWCYNYQENYTLAIQNANKSIAIAKNIGDSASIAQNNNLLGYAFLKTGKHKEALENFTHSYSIRKKNKNWWGASWTLLNIALVHREMGDIEGTFNHLFECLAINRRIGNKAGVVFACNELGLQYTKEKKFKKAELYLREAEILAQEIPLPTQLVSNYRNAILLYKAKNDNVRTIKYFDLYTAWKDTLANELNTSRMASADALFQIQKKANEIIITNKENEIHREQIKNQQSEILFQKKVIAIVAICVVVLLIFVAFIYRLLAARTKAKELLRKQNRAITEQKEEIQAQSEELTESNDKLNVLNVELVEKNSEIELQSERINETNLNLEHRVAERTSQLNQAYGELETFFYKTSHDFRRPLTSYLGLVEIAKASVKDELAIELFDKVKETTIGLDKMLRKLQSISAIDYSGSNAEISFSDVINQSIAKFKNSIAAKGITVTLAIDKGVLNTNEYLYRIFLENIIENSVDFCTPLTPSIAISCTRSGGSIVVIVEDNGQGISAAIQHRIFEMYFRGNDNSKGNGLGLYIAKRAIEKMGGTISFISRLNEGTSFKIVLPDERTPH